LVGHHSLRLVAVAVQDKAQAVLAVQALAVRVLQVQQQEQRQLQTQRAVVVAQETTAQQFAQAATVALALFTSDGRFRTWHTLQN
jgi:hypothetical protein